MPSNKIELPVDAKCVANMFLDWADEIGMPITPMKLQKLLYFAHADLLVTTGQRLLLQSFEAWEFGPVIPSVYQEFKEAGAQPINKRACRFNPVTCLNEVAPSCELHVFEEMVRSSFYAYLRYTASSLSNLSHTEQGPWAVTLEQFARGSLQGKRIDDRVIADHHRISGEDSVH